MTIEVVPEKHVIVLAMAAGKGRHARQNYSQGAPQAKHARAVSAVTRTLLGHGFKSRPRLNDLSSCLTTIGAHLAISFINVPKVVVIQRFTFLQAKQRQ